MCVRACVRVPVRARACVCVCVSYACERTQAMVRTCRVQLYVFCGWPVTHTYAKHMNEYSISKKNTVLTIRSKTGGARSLSGTLPEPYLHETHMRKIGLALRLNTNRCAVALITCGLTLVVIFDRSWLSCACVHIRMLPSHQ